jgi:hypothetical protein
MPQKDVPRTGRELSEWAVKNRNDLGKGTSQDLQEIADSAGRDKINLSSSDLGNLLNPGASASIINRLRRDIGI